MSLAEIKNFNWSEVCFGYYPDAKLFFKSNKGNRGREYIRMHFDKEVMYINEDYVEGSPSGRCFNRNDRFIFEKRLVLGNERILIKHLETEDK